MLLPSTDEIQLALTLKMTTAQVVTVSNSPLYYYMRNWLRAVVFQLNLKYRHVKVTNLLRVVV